MFRKLALVSFLLSAVYYVLSFSGQLKKVGLPEVEMCSVVASTVIEMVAPNYAAIHGMTEYQIDEFKKIFKSEFCLCVGPLSKDKLAAFKNSKESKKIIESCNHRAAKKALENVMMLIKE